MIVLLLFVYRRIGANQLVGTDLTQAVPLTAAAALGALIWGTPQFGVTASIVIGSVPAVLIGSYFSSHAPDRYIRPVITFVIFASGLKYVGVPTTALGIVLVTTAGLGLAFWLVRARPWRRILATAAPVGTAPVPEPVTVPASDPALERERQAPPG
ncbi:MAG TPA: TSUP family transporter, partial [Streptosporangiaceae bacterium]